MFSLSIHQTQTEKERDPEIHQIQTDRKRKKHQMALGSFWGMKGFRRWVFGNQEVADLEMGFTRGEIQPPEVPPNSGIRTTLRDYLSWDYLSWTTKAKRFKPHQPPPSENPEPEPEPELDPPHDDDHGQDKEPKGLSKVTLATQMVLPAAVGWGGYFVIGQGALYNPAFAFSVFGVHAFGILSMFFGWYLDTKNPRVSEFMQKLGQELCIACLILTQIPVSNKLK